SLLEITLEMQYERIMPEVFSILYPSLYEIERGTALASTDYLYGIDTKNLKAFHDNDNHNLQRLIYFYFQFASDLSTHCLHNGLRSVSSGTYRPVWGHNPGILYSDKDGKPRAYPTP
ncbi:MAG: hypothetical protein OXK79_07200, partial [Chloroflexota bacterium]|nr:hypothetical protein [Chloroflexota bacterium]